MHPAVHRLVTPRLTLRPLGAGDASALVDGVGNYDVSKWLSVVPYPYARQDAERFIASSAAAPGLTWAICDRRGLQGVIGAGAELGFWLARGAWGRGYATEAGDAVLDAWFQAGNAQIASAHFAGNTASARVLDKLGFERTGPGTIDARALNQTVDATRMHLTRDRWQRRRRYRLNTARLTIRELRRSDWRALQTIGSDPAVARMMRSIPDPWPDAAVKTWIETSLYRGRPDFRPAVCLKDGTLIGTLGLGKSLGDTELSCAFFIAPSHAGQGYATEALGAFLDDALARFDIPALVADDFADNPASGRVLHKLGFSAVGTGQGGSAARLEPERNILYRLSRSDLKVSR